MSTAAPNVSGVGVAVGAAVRVGAGVMEVCRAGGAVVWATVGTGFGMGCGFCEGVVAAPPPGDRLIVNLRRLVCWYGRYDGTLTPTERPAMPRSHWRWGCDTRRYEWEHELMFGRAEWSERWSAVGLKRIEVPAAAGQLLDPAEIEILRDLGLPRAARGGLFIPHLAAAALVTVDSRQVVIFGQYELHPSCYAIDVGSHEVVSVDEGDPSSLYVNASLPVFCDFLARGGRGV